MTTVRVRPARAMDGVVAVPGDKSISHRALLFGAMATEPSEVTGLSPAADVASTRTCLASCGARLDEPAAGTMRIRPGTFPRTPPGPLDCGNSGTTMRLLSGVLASYDVSASLDGDDSLRSRPMERIAEPLRRMGARVATLNGRPPMRVEGLRPLTGGVHTMAVASAQVKSAILLAGLGADGPVTVVEPAPTRDHTERMLQMTGAQIVLDGLSTTVEPSLIHGFRMGIPGDLSSAAFWMCLAAARPGWRVRCIGVTLNPGRTGVLEVLAAMGASVAVEPAAPAGGVEPVGDVVVVGSELKAVTIDGSVVPRLIDEIPVLAVLATQAHGTTEISDAGELRLKESDRLAEVARGLRALGAEVEERTDGLLVAGPVRLRGTHLHSAGDHRLAMAWAVAGALAIGETHIDGAEVCAVSYPGFFADLERLAPG